MDYATVQMHWTRNIVEEVSTGTFFVYFPIESTLNWRVVCFA